MRARCFGVASSSELNGNVDFCWGGYHVGEAGGHGDDETAGGREQTTQIDEGLTTLVGRQSVHDVERDDALECLRRSRQRADGVGKRAIGDVGAEQMDLLAWSTSGVDSEALVVERPQDVSVEEALNGIDGDTEASANALLRFGHEATAASAELEDAFAGLKLGQLKSGLSIGAITGISIVAAADHVRKGVVDLGEGVEVDHGDGLGGRGLRRVSLQH